MGTNMIIGIILMGLAYGFVVYLVLWSRRTINFIAARKLNSAREILEELHHGR